MFRGSRRLVVHLFSALVPTIQASKSSSVLAPDVLNVAKSELEQRAGVFGKVDLMTPLSALGSELTVQDKQKTIKQFSQCVDELRSVLYQKSRTNPLERLQIHEAIMAAGYHQRTISSTELAGEHIRFVLNHYNFDVRRDTVITQMLHNSLLKNKEITEESEKLLKDILLLERRLYGVYRFAPTSGQRWLVLGLKLSDVDSEEELKRLIDLPAVKADGNFVVTERDVDQHWKAMILKPGTEEACTFAEVSGLYKSFTSATDLAYEIKIQKPVPPMDFWERFKDKLLRYWVIWFSLWVMFFMVDEEIITLVALIGLRWKHMINLENEAKKTGGKIYIAASTGRSIN
eukprot:gene6139-4419_t